MMSHDTTIWKVPEFLVGSTSTVRARVKRLTQHAIKLKSWDSALKDLPAIDVRKTEIQIATSNVHHIMTLIPYVSFDALAQGIGEGCSQPDRVLTREFTKQVILDGLSYFWIVFGVCVDPLDWMPLDCIPLDYSANKDFNHAVLPPLIRVAVNWREQMDWLEKRAKEKAAVDIGETWSNALKTWVIGLEPAWSPEDWEALDTDARARLVIGELNRLQL